MSVLTLFQLFFTPAEGWKNLTKKKHALHTIFLLHVVPFSLIPPVMLYVAGTRGELLLLELLPQNKLLLVCIAFFIVEIVSVAIMALLIKQLSDVVEAKPTYIQAYTLAAYAPTPLWMMPIFLLFPSMAVILVVLSFAMMASAGFIYYGIPETLEVKEEGHRFLLFGAILTAGVIASGFLMIVTLVMWGSVQNLHFV